MEKPWCTHEHQNIVIASVHLSDYAISFVSVGMNPIKLVKLLAYLC